MPTSTISMTDDSQIPSILQHFGYTNPVKIANALQGSVWRSFDPCSNSNVVTKAANKTLHDLSVVILDDVQYDIKENILAEAAILHYLTADPSCPDSIVKYINAFESDNAYFLTMQDGGAQSLFSFTKTAHQCIESGKLSITEWHQLVKLIFSQILESVEYMHSKNVSHFDISLENCIINDVGVQFNSNGDNLTFIHDSVQTKVCDLGLAQFFENGDFTTSKFCGKQPYKSPEVVSQSKAFDAKKNDIFAIGVCLFMLAIGSAPWNIANKDDACFMHIMNGDLLPLLQQWDAAKYVNDDLMELLYGFFQYEDKRITMEEIKKSAWMN